MTGKRLFFIRSFLRRFSFEEEELHVDVVKDAKQCMYLKVNERVCSAGGNGRPETRRSEYFIRFPVHYRR